MEGLSKVSIFQKLSTREIERVGSIVTIKKYAPDTVVFFEGEPSDTLYVLLAGSAKVYTTSHEGHEKILKILGPGEIVGELAMLDGRPRSATVAILEPSEMASIARKDFRELVSTLPELLWKVLEALCQRMRTTSADILELASRDVPYRLLAALNRLGETHGQVGADGSWRIGMKLTVKDLASMVGSNRETVSRLLHQYQDEGLLRLDKNHQLMVPDPKALARALEYATEWA